MDSAKEIARGNRAAALLEDELMVEAFDLIEKEILDKWQNTSASESTAREGLYIALKLHRRLKAHWESVLTTGQMARKTLAQRGEALIGRNTSPF